jgi:hypothetical protein
MLYMQIIAVCSKIRTGHINTKCGLNVEFVNVKPGGTVRLKRDGTRAETRFRLSPKRTSPFKSAGASFQSTAGSRGVRISGSNAVYTSFRGSVKSTGYPLHSPVSPSLPLPCVTVCHQVSNALYQLDATIMIYYDKYPYMFRTSICSSSGVQVVCSAYGVQHSVLWLWS